jgi:N-acetylmuramoyl-L-alanine amidase
MIIPIIDNGHGIDTKGKRSPDESLLEYEFNRWISHYLTFLLNEAKIKYYLLVPEMEDISLKERTKRVNEYCKNKSCILISIHGNGWYEKDKNGKEIKKFNSASGIETFYYNAGKPFADVFHSELIKDIGWKNRGVKKADFYILKYSECPAILTENGFYTNKLECELMKCNEIREVIAIAHFNAIKKIINI